MSIELLPGGATKWWVPESEKGNEPPSRFKISKLSGQQLQHVQSHMQKRGKDEMIMAPDGVDLAISYSLQDWENLKGNPPFSNYMARQLPPEIRNDMAWEIVFYSRLTEEAAGN